MALFLNGGLVTRAESHGKTAEDMAFSPVPVLRRGAPIRQLGNGGAALPGNLARPSRPRQQRMSQEVISESPHAAFSSTPLAAPKAPERLNLQQRADVFSGQKIRFAESSHPFAIRARRYRAEREGNGVPPVMQSSHIRE
jgi:hypothetical protein